MVLFFHALQFSMLCCVWFVVGFGGRVRCCLPFPVFPHVFLFAGVLLYVSVWGIGVVSWFWGGMCGRYLLGGGSMSVVCGMWVLSGVGLVKGLLRDVAGGGA